MSDNLSPSQFSLHGYLHGMKHGDNRTLTSEKTGAVVSIHRHDEVPNGDDGTPARGYKRSTWSVFTPDDLQGRHFASSPYRKHENMQVNYIVEHAAAHIHKLLSHGTYRERISDRLGENEG